MKLNIGNNVSGRSILFFRFFFFFFFSFFSLSPKCREKTKQTNNKQPQQTISKQMIVEELYLDLENLKQSKSGGGRREGRKSYSPTPFITTVLGAPVRPPPHPHPSFLHHPWAGSDFWPTMLSKGVIKNGSGGDHYAGCLGQTSVYLPE